MKLRPYQEDHIARVRKALRKSRRVLAQAPCGAGKTAQAIFMMSGASERGLRPMFIVHQRELLRQTSRALWEQHLEHGMIVAGRRMTRTSTQVASVQTLVRRLDRVAPPDLIIIDEAHRAASKTYRQVIDAFPNAHVVGLTATPQRTDGQGLGDLFGEIVEGPSIRSLIDAGYLSDYEIFAPPSTVDLSSVHMRAGDYDRAELTAAVDRPTITGDAVGHYLRHARGKRCVVMCASLDHMAHVEDAYRQAGVRAESLDGGMTEAEREGRLERFERGETEVLCNVQLLIEGVDVPSIEVVQWLRPTASLIIWMQGNGRGLRPAQGKDRLLILDHVGNWKRHGLPDEDREWSLEGRKKRKRKDTEPDVNIQQCPSCWHVFRPGPEQCPRCGETVKKKPRRELEEVDGELEKVDLAQERKQRAREQGKARSLRELVALGHRRGMNRPAEWAAHVLATREGRKPKGAEFGEARRMLGQIKSGDSGVTEEGVF